MENTVTMHLEDYDKLKSKEQLYRQSVLEMARLAEENETLRETLLNHIVNRCLLKGSAELETYGSYSDPQFFNINYDELIELGFEREELINFLTNERYKEVK